MKFNENADTYINYLPTISIVSKQANKHCRSL